MQENGADLIPIDARNNTDGLQVNTVYPDETNPEIKEFVELDLNSGRFKISFNEPVDIDTFNAMSFTLQSSSNGGSILTLTDGSIQYSEDVDDLTEIDVELDPLDLQELKLDINLGTEEQDSYIYFSAGAIDDVAGNPVVAIQNTSAERIVNGGYIRDTTPPSLSYFSLDMDEGVLHLSFDDIMDASSFDVTRISFQTTEVSNEESYELTGGDTTTENGYNITVNLTETDLNELKASGDLGKDESSTFIVMPPNTITDIAGVELIGITETSARIVDDYRPDETSPELISFIFDLGGGLLQLNFTEAVDLTMYEPTQITLQNSANISAFPNTVQYNITSAVLESVGDSRQIYNFIPSLTDINNIKAELDLGTNQNDTYIVFPSTAFQDLFGNLVIPITVTDAKQTFSFEEDMTAPTLTSYVFDLDSGILSLTFSESIQISTFNYTGLSIRSFPSSSSEVYSLTDGNTDTKSGNVIVIDISTNDLNGIKANSDLATAKEDDNTYLVIRDDTYEDTSGNPGQVYPPNSATSPSNFINDTTPPELNAFTFDLGTGLFHLTFSETVDPDTLNPDAFGLQSAPAFPVHSIALSGITTNSSRGPEIYAFLYGPDLDVIKQSPGFATARGNTYLSIGNGTVEDMAGNLLVGIPSNDALQTTMFVEDNIAPELVSFTLDMDTGALNLSFSESVLTEGILDLTSITLQTNDDPTENYTLTGGAFLENGPLPLLPIQLSTEDLNSIKDFTDLAKSTDSTYISIAADATLDVSDIPLIESPANDPVQASNVKPDVTPPELVGFEIRLIEEPLQFIFTFNETILEDSVDLTSFQLHDGSGFVTISLDGNFYRETLTVLVVNVSETILNLIRSDMNLARDSSSTVFNIQSDAVKDAFEVGFTGTSDVIATKYNADLVPPTILEYTFDLDNGEIVLTFDENVQGENLNTSSISLVDTIGSTSETKIEVLSYLVVSSNTVKLRLKDSSINEIKTNTDLATDNETTYIIHDEGLVCDIANNCAEERLAASAKEVTTYIRDTTSPELDRFDLVANTRELTLYFNEVVNATSLDPRQITFQNTDVSYPTREYTLTNGSIESNDGLTIQMIISVEDKNNIKALGDLLTEAGNTYISITSELVLDMAGNTVEEIRPRDAKPVNLFLADTDHPQIVSASLDLNSGVFTLDFNETVNITSLDVSEIALSYGTTRYVLTDSEPMTPMLDPNMPASINISLSYTDLNMIKSLSLCTSAIANDCQLSYSSTLVSDFADRPIIERPSTTPLAVIVKDDITGPILNEFKSIDFIEGTVTLVFNEPVDNATLNASNLVFQSLFTNPAATHGIQNATVESTGLTSVTIALMPYDFFALQEEVALCTGRGNCYVRLYEGFIVDLFGNTNMEVEDGFPGKIVTSFVMDETNPSLEEFNFDMNNGVLSLFFSEPVSISSLNVMAITIQAKNNTMLESEYYQLTDGSATASDGDRAVHIQLVPDDINELKLRSFASNENDTYISLESSTITDTSLNSVNTILRSSAKQVLNYTKDSSPPILMSFSIDIDSDTLLLSFDEPISIDSVIFSAMILQSDEVLPSVSIRLREGIITNNDSAATVASLLLHPTDVAEIKLNELIATTESNTYLNISQNALTDVAGNEIEQTGPLSAGEHQADISRPQLDYFSLDIQKGIMNITFDDVVNASTFDATAFTIQSSIEATVDEVVALSSSTNTSSEDGYTIVVDISTQDLISIRDIENLATSKENTFLTMQAYAIDDIFGTDVLAITDGKALQVQSFYPDNDPPELEYFDLDLNEGILLLKLSDLVNQSTFNSGALILYGMNMVSPPSLTISGGIVTRLSDGCTISLKLSDSDIDSVMNMADLGTSVENTFLTLEESYITDLAGNQAPAVTTPEMVRMVINDTTGPKLEQFNFDLNNGILEITLNELAVADSFNVIYISFQGESNVTENMDSIYTLSSETTLFLNNNSRTFEIVLSDNDLNNLKANPLVGTSRDTTYISFNGPVFLDISGNAAMNISLELARQARTYMPDITPPTLVDFDLDMNASEIVFTFSETVDLTSLDFSEVLLQGSQDGLSGSMYTLLNGEVAEDYAKTIVISISNEDLFELQLRSDLATMKEDTFISVTSMAVKDSAGVDIEEIAMSEAKQVKNFTADFLPPELVSFNLDLNIGFLNLTFSEVVNTSSFTPTLVHFSESVDLISALHLNDTSPEQNNEQFINVELSNHDLNRLKSEAKVGKSRSTTYIFLDNGAVTDTFENNISSVDSALKVRTLVLDTTSPKVQGFELDIGARRLVLYFNEFINGTVFTPTSLTIINGTGSLSESSYYRLTTSSRVFSTLENRIEISIGSDDFNMISGIIELATKEDNTFLLLDGAAVIDLFNNPLFAIRARNPFQVTAFEQDNERPSLSAFTIDMDAGSLSLTFTEAVNEPSLDASGITLYSTQGEVLGREELQLRDSNSDRTAPNIVLLIISPEDLNSLKAMNSLAKNRESTFIAISSNVITDTAELMVTPIDQSNATMADVFINDTSSPKLETFSLDLNTGIMTLVFNETIDVTTLNLTTLLLQSIRFFGGTEVNFPTTSQPSINSAAVEVTISRTDLNEIKRLPLCTEAMDCYISFPSTSVNDVAGNPVTAISRDQAEMANFTSDETAPFLEEFEIFDLNAGNFTLKFSETVNITSFQPTEIRLQEDFSSGFEVFTLTTGEYPAVNSDVITVMLSESDLNSIKYFENLCHESNSRCWIRFNSSLVSDMAGNNVSPAENTDDIFSADVRHRAEELILDTTRPTLDSFVFDLSNESITLSFSETVDAGEFYPQYITIQDNMTANQSYPLAAGTINTEFTAQTSVTFNMISSDITELQANILLATNEEDTYITFTSELVKDTSGNEVVPAIDVESAIKVTNYKPDRVKPQLTAFLQLHMNQEQIQLEFSEPMDESFIDFTGISIRSGTDSPIHYVLTGGSNVATSNLRQEITFDLTADDVRGIKLQFSDNLATSVVNTFISIEEGSFTDTSGNDIVEVSTTSAVQADDYEADTTSPRLLSYVLDINSGEISLTFDDVMDTDSVMPSFFTFQNKQVFDEDTVTVSLTNVVELSTNDFIVDYMLVSSDLNALKAEPHLGTIVENTYLAVGSNGILDVADTLLIPRLASDGLQARNVTPDIERPSLDSFMFNVSTGRITFAFSEVVNVSGIDPTGIVLQSSADNPEFSRELTSGSTSTLKPSQMFDYILSEADINYIKEFTNFGTNESNTFLALESTTIADMAGNRLEPIARSEARPASELHPDILAPALKSYSLNMNNGELTLTFTETVNVSTVDPEKFFIQGSESELINVVRLTNDSSVSGSPSEVFIIMIGTTDLNNIKANMALATEADNTYLRMQPDAVYDQNNIGTEGIANGMAVMVTEEKFTGDSTQPTLSRFEVNMGIGLIKFTFSESVDVSTFDATAFLLMNTPNFRSAAYQRQLTGQSNVTEVNGPNVNLFLNFDDLNFIKAETLFFTNEINSYISLTSEAVRDNQGNPIQPIANTTGQQVAVFTMDDIEPELSDFILDLNANTLIMTFSETVFSSSFIVSGITLHADRSESAPSYNLIGAESITPSADAILTVQLLLEDANALKQDLSLAVSVNTTFLSIRVGSITDTNNNNISEIEVDDAYQAFNVIPDETPPTLVSFSLEMDNKTSPVTLLLTFSETVNGSSLSITSITLQENSDSVIGESYTLQSSGVGSENSDVLTVTLSFLDLEEIRDRPKLGQNDEMLYLSMPEGTVLDMARQPSDRVPFNNAEQASLVTADLIPPELEGFTLDKNLGHLLITFSEAINSSTFVPTTLTLTDGSITSLQITTTEVFESEGELVTVILNSYDQNFIKNSSSLGISNTSTVMSFPPSIVEDIAGNDALAVISKEAQNIIEDTTGPVLTTFSIDFQTMQIELVFNEPVEASSLDVRHMVLQNENATFPQYTYRLNEASSVDSSQLGTIITIELSVMDRNNIQSISDLGNNSTDTYLAVDPETIQDTSGNMVSRVSPSMALKAAEFGEDNINPQLQTFSLDMNDKVLTLGFTESVNGSAMNFSKIYVHDSARSKTYFFTASDSSPILSSSISISISDDDFNNFAATGLCGQGLDCYITLDEGAIYDTVGLPSVEIDTHPLDSFVEDNIAPTILEFTSLDLATGQLNLTFSESVLPSTLNTSTVMLLSFFTEAEEMYTVSSLASHSSVGTVVSFYLTEEDISNIKVMQLLCVRRSNCYIAADAGLIEDVAGNPSSAIVEGINVALLFDDTLKPNLTKFDFDLNIGNITLYFNEPMDIDTFEITEIVLQSNDGMFNDVENVRLTKGQVSSLDNNMQFHIGLDSADINAIKTLPTLASSPSTTFLSLSSNTVSDLSVDSNNINAIPTNSPQHVSSYIYDDTHPSLLEFEFDINADSLVLTFDEPVNKSTLQVSRISLFSTNSSENPDDFGIMLSNGQIASSAITLSTIVTIIMERTDIGEVKGNSSIGVDVNNTYLEVGVGTVYDRRGNSLQASERLQASDVIPDTTRPQLLSYTFDVELGEIILTFNDVVDVLTFDATAFTVQDDASRTISYNLGSLTDSNSQNGYIITVTISPEDLLNIKLTSNLATSKNDTYITMQAFAIDDISGEDVLAITDGKALQAEDYIEDRAPPEINDFELDLNVSELIIYFNEAINSSSLDSTLVSVYSNTNGDIEYEPTGHDNLETIDDSTTLIIYLNREDSNELKRSTSLATSTANTFVHLEPNFIKDLAENYFPMEYTKQVVMFTDDETAPEIESFSLDMDTGELVINFTEGVRDFGPLGYTLQPNINSSSTPLQTHTLSDSSLYEQNDLDTYTITLSQDDINSINAIPQLATSASRTRLSVSNISAVDYRGNSIVPVDVDSGITASVYTNDETSPQFFEFYLDLDSNLLSLTFNEVVRASSFNFSGVILKSQRNGGSSLRLGEGTQPSNDLTTLNVTLSLDDTAALQLDTNLATSRFDTFIALESTAVTDVSGNGGNYIQTIPINNAEMAESVFADISPPSLESFTLNLANITITLTFSEYIDVDNLEYSSMFLLNSDDQSTALDRVLSNSMITSEQMDHYIINIALASTDFLFLQTTPSIGSSPSNTYLYILDNALSDLAGNLYLSETPIPATEVISDNSPPHLEEFALNLGLQRFVLTFSEPVDTTSFTVSELTVFSSLLAVNGYNLDNSTVGEISPDGTVININLGNH